jgi:hypothetical protein
MKFQGFWKKKEHQRLYLDWFAQQNNLKSDSDWYQVVPKVTLPVTYNSLLDILQNGWSGFTQNVLPIDTRIS